MTKTSLKRTAAAVLTLSSAVILPAPTQAQAPSCIVNTSVVVTVPGGKQVRTDTLGWIYVGHFVDGSWDREPGLTKVGSNIDNLSVPRVGEEIVLKRAMNLRAEPIYRNISGLGTVNTAKIAQYQAGQRFIVASVHDVRYPDGFIWIEVVKAVSN